MTGSKALTGLFMTDGSRKTGFGQCFAPNTMILGDNKEIKNINEGNIVSSNFGLTKVSHKFVRQYNGDILKIKAMGLLPIEVTPEHPILTIKRRYHSNNATTIFYWEKAENLVAKKPNRLGNYLLIPRNIGTISMTVLDMKPFLNPLDHRSSVKINNIPLNAQTAWILGLYVAEGSMHDGAVFSLDKEEKHLESKVIQFANSLHKKCTIEPHKYKRSMTVCINFAALGRAFDYWCGHKAHNKKIPDFILYNTDINILQSFLDGYVAGDGCKYKKRIHMPTVSKVLALQLQLAFAVFGILGTISIIKPHDTLIYGKPVHGGQIYQIDACIDRVRVGHITNDFILVPIKSIIRTPYNGNVHNIETENNTYLVSNIVVHNCAYNICKGLGQNNYKMYHLSWGVRVDEPLGGENYTILPCGNHPFGADVLLPTLQALNPDFLLTQNDTRMLLDWFPQQRQYIKTVWINYPVVDGSVWSPDYKMDKWPSNWTEFMKLADYTVAMSQFGQRILKNMGIDATYIPHGVDTSIFKPLQSDTKKTIRKSMGLSEDRFVMAYVFKNMWRKLPAETLKIFRLFKDTHPKTKPALILHTTVDQGEFNIPLHVNDYGLKINEDVYFSQPALPMHMMNLVYNAADVYLAPVAGEGFNLPLLEAMSSGLPCLTTDYSTGPELVGDCGVLGKLATFKNKKPVTISSYNAVEFCIPDIYDFSEKLYELHQDPKLRQDLGAKATVKATQNYDWNLIVPKWKQFLDKNCNIELPADWKAALA